MKSPLNLLVVEDNANHIADLRTMLEEELPRLPITVNILWASDLQEAMTIFDQSNPDAVMTDVFFPPARGGNDKEPNGQKVVERSLMEQRPVVWVTSTYHHGRQTDGMSSWGRDHGLEMFDCYIDDNKDGEAPHKPWKEALYGLLLLILHIDAGKCIFQDGRMEETRIHKGEKQFQTFMGGTRINFAIQQFFSDKEIDVKNIPLLLKMVELGFPRN
jgi:CheY-like chemotaxis protein